MPHFTDRSLEDCLASKPSPNFNNVGENNLLHDADHEPQQHRIVCPQHFAGTVPAVNSVARNLRFLALG